MKLFSFTLAACSVAFWMAAPAWAESDKGKDDTPNKPEVFEANDSPAAVHWARGEAHSGGGAGSSPNMTWHGGPVMTGTVVQAIFWGKGWSSPGDKISAMDSWYQSVGGTNYAKTNTEYSGSNGQASSIVTYNGHIVDTSAAPSGAPRTATILGKVCSAISGAVTASGYYPVYVDTKRGNAGYCAWHSWGSCGGTPIQFGFFFNLDGDPGCDPGSPFPNALSQGANAIANVSGHELSETITDRDGNAWYDRSGNENGDKCAWTFSGTAVQFSNKSNWKIQGNWSNAAYNANQGYSSGGSKVRGCIDGN